MNYRPYNRVNVTLELDDYRNNKLLDENVNKKNNSIGVMILFLIFSLLMGFFVWLMLTNGHTIARGEGHSRADSPIVFWSYIIVCSGFSMASLIAAFWPSKNNKQEKDDT